MTTLILSALVIVALLPLATYHLGIRHGIKRGHENSKAIGWLEHHEQAVARDRARRDRYGKFAVKGGRTT